MLAKSNLEEQCLAILEEKGGQIADEARTILLKEKSLRGLRKPLLHVAENWRDPSTSSLVILSCEAVGGEVDEPTRQAALALTLMGLSFTVWDDLVDAHIYPQHGFGNPFCIRRTILTLWAHPHRPVKQPQGLDRLAGLQH